MESGGSAGSAGVFSSQQSVMKHHSDSELAKKYQVTPDMLKVPKDPATFFKFTTLYRDSAKDVKINQKLLHAIFPSPAPDMMEPVCGMDLFYSKTFIDSVRGTQWGPGEGPPQFPELYQEIVWQSRTQFTDVKQSWQTYPPNHQQAIEAAWAAGKPNVQISFASAGVDSVQTSAGNLFEIDFKRSVQENIQDRQRVREVRRIIASKPRYYSISQEAESDPKPFSPEANAKLVQGTAPRSTINGAICFEVELDGKSWFADLANHKLYSSSNGHGNVRRVFCIPEPIAEVVDHVSGSCDTSTPLTLRDLPRDSVLFKRISAHFDATKFGMRANSGVISLHEHLYIKRIQYAIQPKQVIQFLEKMKFFGKDARLSLVFHGTSDDNIYRIMQDNFAASKISEACGDQGWFGKGFYFGRRAYTALGYNKGHDKLLCCLVVTKRTFVCPLPDTAANPYNGKPCKVGCDAHVSPTGKELVIFNPRQILPCFLLHLDANERLRADDECGGPLYDTQGFNDYYVGVF